MEYVYANNTGEVLYAPTGAVWMNLGDAWHADDPFVAFRPDLFSSTPVVVRSTTGKDEQLPPTPVGEPKKRAGRGRG